jgi:hypothetical protein
LSWPRYRLYRPLPLPPVTAARLVLTVPRGDESRVGGNEGLIATVVIPARCDTFGCGRLARGWRLDRPDDGGLRLGRWTRACGVVLSLLFSGSSSGTDGRFRLRGPLQPLDPPFHILHRQQGKGFSSGTLCRARHDTHDTRDTHDTTMTLSCSPLSM